MTDIIWGGVYFTIAFIYLFLAMLGVHGCTRFLLVVLNRSYSLIAVCGLLIAMASLVE